MKDIWKVLLALSFLGLMIFGVYKCTSKLNQLAEEDNKKEVIMKSYLGNTIVLAKDSLLIIDFNRYTKIYKLSNGTEVDMDFVYNLDKSKIFKK